MNAILCHESGVNITYSSIFSKQIRAL